MSGYEWAEASLLELSTIDPDLRWCCDWVLARSEFDLAAREGRRDREAQERYYAAGLSNARWGESAHNAIPPARACAIHLIPLPIIGWDDPVWLRRCAVTAGLMRAAALERGIMVVWGGWWSDPFDPAHFEVRNGRDEGVRDAT